MKSSRLRTIRAAPSKIERLPSRAESCQVPIALEDGVFKVDATWGRVQPVQLAPGVRTVGELEVIEHIEQGKPLVDTRLEHFYRNGTIARAHSIPHQHILGHLDELDAASETVFFCNGPQCPATPDAIRQLLGSGYPAAKILYYRGGIHDWVTLGFPIVTRR